MKINFRIIIYICMILLSTQISAYDELVGSDNSDRHSILNVSFGANQHEHRYTYQNAKTRYFLRGGYLMCQSNFSRKIINKKRWKFINNRGIFIKDDNYFYLSECHK